MCNLKSISYEIERTCQFLLVILLLFNTPFVVSSAESTTKICVDPPYYLGTAVSETFTIKINITDIANLYGFDFRITWNGTLIRLTRVEILPPWSPNFIAKNESSVLPSGKTYHWLAVSAIMPASPFSGSTVIAKLTFHVEHAPYYPEPDLSTSLDLGVANPGIPLPEAFTKLSDPVPAPIPHEVYSGLYEIKTMIPPPPELEVEPPTFTALDLSLIHI